MTRTKPKTKKFKPSQSLLPLPSPSSMAQATQPPSTPNPPSIHRPWPEKDELSLLTAILEIAKEPAGSYNPRINLYDRIAKILDKPFSNKEVLGKVKELRTRYEKKCCNIRNGHPVKRTAAFEMSEKVWGVEMQKREDKPPKNKKANGEEAVQSNKTLQEIEHGHKLEVKTEGVAEPKSASFNEETIPHDKPELKRPLELTKGGDDVRLQKKRNRGRNQEKDKTACFNCRKPGHFAHECIEEKIEKQSGEQQEAKEISKDAAGLQVKTESRGEEQSSTLVSACVQPASHQLKPPETQHKAKVPNSPHHDQKRVNVFQAGAYRPEQRNVVDRFLSNGHQLFPQHWNTGPAPPPYVPQPPAWGPRTPIPPMPHPLPPMPYRYPPPYSMNYPIPRNYPPMFNNSNPRPNFIPSPAQNSPRFAPQR